MSRLNGRVLDTPPARLYEMKRKHKQKYWQCVKLAAKEEYTGLPDSELETKHCEFAYCELCRVTIYCSIGNNDVGKHMQMFHKDLLKKYDEDARVEKERHELRTSADGSKRLKKSTRPISQEDQQYGNYLLAKWIAESMRPLSVVEDPGFLQYVEFITGVVGGIDVAVPGRTALREIIGDIAKEKRASLAAELNRGCKFYSLTTDLWTDRSLRSFMSSTIHYVDAEFKSFSWLLGIRSVPVKHNAERIESELNDMMSEWRLQKSRCAMLLSDGAKNAVKAAELLKVPHMSCVAHSLHLVVGAALLRKPRRPMTTPATTSDYMSTQLGDTEASVATEEEEVEYDEEDAEVEGDGAADILQERESICHEVQQLVAENVTSVSDQEHIGEMRDIVAVFRKIATYFHKSSKAKNRLARFQNVSEVKQLILDCPTRWDSTFGMTERFEELKPALTEFFDFTSGAERAEFSDMKIRCPKFSDWFAIKCLSVLLHEFAFVSQRIGGEAYPTMIMVFPLLRLLKESLMNTAIFDPVIAQAREEGHDALGQTIAMMHGVRRSLLSLFTKRFKGMRIELLWVPLIDPRQAKMKGYLDPDEVEEAKNLMLEALIKLQEDEQPSQITTVGDVDQPAFQSPVRASQRVNDRYDDRLYGPRVPSRPPTATEMTIHRFRSECEKEIKRYFDQVEGEDEVDRDTQPNDWWRLNGRRVPMLAELARKWLGCVGTSVPSERVFSTSGNIVSVKRCSLTPEMVEDLAFIAHNIPAKK
jgi:hypothetical protein